MEKFSGQIKSKTKALHLAEMLEDLDTKWSNDCAALLRRNWRYFAARKAESARVFALLENKGLPEGMTYDAAMMNENANE